MAEAEKPHKRPAPWRGRPRVADPKSRRLTLRLTGNQFDTLNATADRTGMSMGELLRVKAFNSPDPRAIRRPPVEVREIARLYGEIGKLGSNVNQLAYHANATHALPVVNELQAMNFYLMEMHDALMRALGREP
jgi:hypothetical protein